MFRFSQTNGNNKRALTTTGYEEDYVLLEENKINHGDSNVNTGTITGIGNDDDDDNNDADNDDADADADGFDTGISAHGAGTSISPINIANNDYLGRSEQTEETSDNK